MGVRAVELVREIRDRQYELSKGLSLEEQMEFIREKPRALQEELGRIQLLNKGALPLFPSVTPVNE